MLLLVLLLYAVKLDPPECRNVKLRETGGIYDFVWTGNWSGGEHPIYSTRSQRLSTTLFLLFDVQSGSWAVKFDMSPEAQSYYSALALISDSWNVFSHDHWVSGGSHVYTTCANALDSEYVYNLTADIPSLDEDCEKVTEGEVLELESKATAIENEVTMLRAGEQLQEFVDGDILTPEHELPDELKTSERCIWGSFQSKLGAELTEREGVVLVHATVADGAAAAQGITSGMQLRRVANLFVYTTEQALASFKEAEKPFLVEFCAPEEPATTENIEGSGACEEKEAEKEEQEEVEEEVEEGIHLDWESTVQERRDSGKLKAKLLQTYTFTDDGTQLMPMSMPLTRMNLSGVRTSWINLDQESAKASQMLELLNRLGFNQHQRFPAVTHFSKENAHVGQAHYKN